MSGKPNISKTKIVHCVVDDNAKHAFQKQVPKLKPPNDVISKQVCLIWLMLENNTAVPHTK